MLFNLAGKRVKGIYLNQIMINKHVGTLHHVAAVSCTPVSEAPGCLGPVTIRLELRSEVTPLGSNVRATTNELCDLGQATKLLSTSVFSPVKWN